MVCRAVRRKKTGQRDRAPARSLQKARERFDWCHAAGHSAKACVTGCKSAIGACREKTKARRATFRADRHSPQKPGSASEVTGELPRKNKKSKCIHGLSRPVRPQLKNCWPYLGFFRQGAFIQSAGSRAATSQLFWLLSGRPPTILTMPARHPQRMARQPGRTCRSAKYCRQPAPTAACPI